MFETVYSREQYMWINCYSGTTFESLMRCSSTRSQDECRRQSARPTIRVAQESRVRERILASQSRQVGGVGNGTAGLWACRPSVWRTGGVGDPRRTSRVCWARVSDPAHRCDRRAPTPWRAHRGGSERFGPTNSIARIRWRTQRRRARCFHGSGISRCQGFGTVHCGSRPIPDISCMHRTRIFHTPKPASVILLSGCLAFLPGQAFCRISIKRG
jgi:hypothetical protein